MWQADKDGSHLLWDYNNDLRGVLVETACGKRVKANPKKQTIFPSASNNCAVCNSLWHIVCTSVADAKDMLKKEINLHVLERVMLLSRSLSLRKMAQARINRLKKDAEKERKLHLLQQAYD